VRIAEVVALSRERKALRLADGAEVSAAALVIATGLRPRAVSWPDAPVAGLLDAIGLTLARAQFRAPQRLLLMGAGDNAAENAPCLARRGHRVVLWARSGWRAQPALQGEIEHTDAIEVRLHTPLPTEVVRESGGWHVASSAHGQETFDQAAALFGFEPDDA